MSKSCNLLIFIITIAAIIAVVFCVNKYREVAQKIESLEEYHEHLNWVLGVNNFEGEVKFDKEVESIGLGTTFYRNGVLVKDHGWSGSSDFPKKLNEMSYFVSVMEDDNGYLLPSYTKKTKYEGEAEYSRLSRSKNAAVFRFSKDLSASSGGYLKVTKGQLEKSGRIPLFYILKYSESHSPADNLEHLLENNKDSEIFVVYLYLKYKK